MTAAAFRRIRGFVWKSCFVLTKKKPSPHLRLTPATLHEVQASEIKLAGLQAPAGLDPGTKSAVTGSIKQAFVVGFRVVILICAGLSVVSAAVAQLMIRAVAQHH